MGLTRISFSKPDLLEISRNPRISSLITDDDLKTFFEHLDAILTQRRNPDFIRDEEPNYSPQNIYQALSLIENEQLNKNRIFLEFTRNYKFKKEDFNNRLQELIHHDDQSDLPKLVNLFFENLEELKLNAPDLYSAPELEYTLENIIDALLISKLKYPQEINHLKDSLLPNELLSEKLFDIFLKAMFNDKQKPQIFEDLIPHQFHDDPSLDDKLSHSSHAITLRGLMFNKFVTNESKERIQLLHDAGSKIENRLREKLKIGSLKIILVPYGSSLKGYANQFSDLEFGLHIYSKDKNVQKKINKFLCAEDTNADILNIAKEEIIKLNPNVSIEELLPETSNIENLSEFFENHNKLCTNIDIFLPIAYGNKEDIGRLRANILRTYSIKGGSNSLEWTKMQENFRDCISLGESDEIKAKAFVWLKRAGLIPYRFVQDGLEAINSNFKGLFELPALDTMLRGIDIKT